MDTFHGALKKAQDQYAIVGKDLAKKVGIGQQHLTNIRSGKAWPSEEVLMRILSAMEELAPGSRFYFFLLMMGDDAKKYRKRLKQVAYEDMGDEELADHLMMIGQAWKSNQLKRSQKNPTEQPSINVTNTLK
ncbi:MAG: helix-turn-helix transcriptional regulator [Prochloraceae cyanobacterium]|nr:helix-turn-helix transcriptional regulator [Prochloraceae cyanobacterium]